MRKKVLIISGIRIFPPQSGGHQRTANLAKALARQGYCVKIYALTARRNDYHERLSFKSFPIESHLEELVDVKAWRGLCQALFRRLGLARVWQYFLLPYRFLPKALIQEIDQADLVFCDFPFFSFVEKIKGLKPIILISHNLEHRILQQESEWKRKLLAPWVQNLEARAGQQYHGVFACTDEDARFFQVHAPQSTTIKIVPNGVDGRWYKRNEQQRRDTRQQLGIADDEIVLLFTASAYEPNRQAFQWLNEFIHAHQQQLRSWRLRFLVVGSVSPKSFRNDVLIVTSFVDDIRPYFSASDLAINPVETGSGSNVKVYEAIAAQLPLLSTKFGARGLDLIPQVEYIPFEKADFKASLQYLISHRDRWKEMGEKVLHKYRTQVLMEDIISVNIRSFL
ncbi:MAG: glycosyltransferase family 4 protein [Oligoflexus sp.]